MRNNSSIFVLVISLFIIIFIIISYFVLSNSIFKSNIPEINYIETDNSLEYDLQDNNVNLIDEIGGSNNLTFLEEQGLSDYINDNANNDNIESGENEVFHLRDNIYNYDEAKAACKAYDSRLATLKEVINSYKNGSNWCNYGWSQDQLVLYPTQTNYWKKLQENTSTKKKCGVPGVNGGYFHNPYFEIGANCYGEKPSEPNSSKFIKNPPTDLELMTKNFKDLIDVNKLKVAPFNESKWSQ
jgi:hypothetical protein